MLQKIILQHFRNYNQQEFQFLPGLNIVVGPNTAGKTNLCEAIILLSTGKSFRANKDIEIIGFGEEVARVKASVGLEITPYSPQKNMVNSDQITLEVTIAQGNVTGGRFMKRFQLNGVGKSRNSFVGNLPAVLFRPEELEIATHGPSLRRVFLDEALEQVDSEYCAAKLQYDKALRQRNALIDIVRDNGNRKREQFAYWDNLLIEHGATITQKRGQFLDFINSTDKEIFELKTVYDKSLMSEERLLQYKDAEIRAGMTLIGPQRDDFQIFMKSDKNVQQFGSRGQQRLAVLQLKIIQLEFVKIQIGFAPILVLDDIFSELDSGHIALVLEKVKGSQIILTTTHGEFVNGLSETSNVIKLNE